VLVNNSSWDWVAGDAHNAVLDLILGGGFVATLIVMLGCAGAAIRAWRVKGGLRIGALATYVFVAGFGVVAPNLTNLQALSTFVIIVIDSMVCNELASLRAGKVSESAMTFNGKSLANLAST
jgi:O-antigen ligase